jgi:hypothetical protein
LEGGAENDGAGLFDPTRPRCGPEGLLATPHDGSEVFYRLGSKMMAVPVSMKGGFQVGKPRMLSDAPSTVLMTNWLDAFAPGRH